MKRVCAWCHRPLETEEEIYSETGPITHGICPDCVRKTMRHEAVEMGDFLNQFTYPVLLVNDDVKVVAANSAAMTVLQKNKEEITGHMGGEVISCSHAKLPQGCGKTVHCKYCTIRNTVEDTYRTGRCHVKVPAYPDLHTITKERAIRFLISTEKVGNHVLLQIDDVR